jgi:hypothetical protein
MLFIIAALAFIAAILAIRAYRTAPSSPFDQVPDLVNQWAGRVAIPTVNQRPPKFQVKTWFIGKDNLDPTRAVAAEKVKRFGKAPKPKTIHGPDTMDSIWDQLAPDTLVDPVFEVVTAQYAVAPRLGFTSSTHPPLSSEGQELAELLGVMAQVPDGQSGVTASWGLEVTRHEGVLDVFRTWDGMYLGSATPNLAVAANQRRAAELLSDD